MKSVVDFLTFGSPKLWAIALCLGMGAGLVRADDKITLKLDVEPGQVWKFERAYDESLNSKAQSGGQTQTDENKNHQHRVGTIQILAVKDGRPTSARIAYGADCETTMESDGQAKDVPFAFKGQTITITRGEDGTIQSDFHGQADPSSMSEVNGALDPDLSLYPDHPVAVGDEWKANDDIAHKQLGLNGPNDTGDMKFKLLSVKDVNGRSTAEIAVESEASIDMHGVVRKTHATGSALIDVQTGHVMKFDLKGTSNIAGTAKNQGTNGKTIKVRWDGDGTMTMSLTSEIATGADVATAANTGAPTAVQTGAPTVAAPIVAPTAAQPGASADGVNVTLPGEPSSPSPTANATGVQTNTPSANPLSPPQSLSAAGHPAAAGGAGKQLLLESHTMMDDPSYIGGEVCRFLLPAGWKTEGGVVWDLTTSYPAQTHMRMYDPNSAEAFELDPTMFFTWQPNPNQQYAFHPQQGSKYAGGVFEPPVQDVYTAITKVVIPAYYKDLAHSKARIVEKEDLPKLAQLAQSRIAPLPNAQITCSAARMRFEYEDHGQVIQQDIYAALAIQVNQRFNTMDWHIGLIISEQAPKGMLDQVKAYRFEMQRSTMPNIQWYNKLFQFSEAANQQKIKEIQATGERSRIFAEMTNEVNEQRKEQFENYQKSTAAQALAVDQYIRDVTPYNTPNGPPVELPNSYSNAWQGTNGQYIMTNDPNYNPAADPNNQQFGWTQLTPQR